MFFVPLKGMRGLILFGVDSLRVVLKKKRLPSVLELYSSLAFVVLDVPASLNILYLYFI